MTSKFLKNHGDWFVPLTIWVVGVILLSASMVLIENVSIQDSVWYTVITSSTVGYGGIIASEPVTRILTIIFIFTSIGSLTAFIGAFVIRSRKFTEKKRKGLMTSKRDPDVIIAGYPTEAKVKELVRGLKHLWKGVSITCVTNQIEEKPGWMVDEDVEFIQGRASERSVMERANLHLAEKVMILANDPTCPDSDEYTSSIVMLCEILNPNAHTIAEKVRDNDDLFKLAKCDKVVDVCRPSELVHELLHEGAIEFIDT
ncbi:MAG: NAD-binding protein, partial [Candidatus Peribacteraceae bacterium]|nr:NAD-binding protein [Candidatus Peribacteraceae bacterium]